MRKTLLFVKVCLLLAAFVGSSSSHAAKFGDHNLLDNSTVDFSLALGAQSTEDDEPSASVSAQVPLSFHPATLILEYVPVVAKDLASKPFARAPPVNPSV
jgi:hypothetical protein